MATNNAVNTSLSGQTGTGSFVGSTSPTLETPDIGAATGTSLNLSADISARNKWTFNAIIGGDFTKNPWQRGTTFTGIATGSYAADCWRVDYVTSAVVDVTRDSTAPTAAEAGVSTSHSLKVAVTTADAAIAAGDYFNVTQRIEGYWFANLASLPMTLSFWVRSTKTGTYCVSIVNRNNTYSWIGEYTINAANTWEKKTINIDTIPAAADYSRTNTVGVQVSFALAVGSTFQTTANAWQAAQYFGTSNQVNGLDSNTNTWQVCLVQLESGSFATPFQQVGEREVVHDCQRYYWKTFDLALAPAQNTGIVANTIGYRAAVAGAVAQAYVGTYPVNMRATPTAVYYNPSNTNTNWRNVTGGADSGASSSAYLANRAVLASNAGAAGDAAGNFICIHVTCDASL